MKDLENNGNRLRVVWNQVAPFLRILLIPFTGCRHDFKKVNGHLQVGPNTYADTYGCPVCRRKDLS